MILEKLREFKNERGKHYRITLLALFGSYARGDQDEYSDIDIAVKATDASLFDYGGIDTELKERINDTVNVTPLTRTINQKFLSAIQKDMIYV